MEASAKVTIQQVTATVSHSDLAVDLKSPIDKARFDDVGFLTSMLFVLMGNYAQAGHYGGPLSYTPANVTIHLAGKENGGLCYDIRHPKHPFADKFMLTGGHCIPTCYGLWMALYEAMDRQHKKTGDEKYKCNPHEAILGIDALGFRRGAGALETLLKANGLEDDPLFAQAKIRGIRALMGHSETTDVTNDVNGGPSGIGAATTAGKAMFWDFVGAPQSTVKIIAFEGEFAFTEGHAQELKTIALSQQTGKRLRLFFSYNNAGIDDSLIGGVVKEKFTDYNIANQFISYGWNVFEVKHGESYEELHAVFKAMEDWPAEDKRPMVVIAHTLKGWWPTGLDGRVGSTPQVVSYASHPYAFGMNSPYFVALAQSFEQKFGVSFDGLSAGKAPADEKARLVQFKRNIDVALSVLDKDGLGEWVANRLLSIAGTLPSEFPSLRFPTNVDPFADERLKPSTIPTADGEYTIPHPISGKDIKFNLALFAKPGQKKGARRAISEVGKWINYVTNNRMLTIAADLSHSINMEAVNLTGHYDPVDNVSGTRLKAGIQECANTATVCGLVSQTLSSDPSVHSGVWAMTGTYGAFTPLMYLPLRIFSQQNQDSPFGLGVVTVIAGHSGPETAADARSHFGIFAPQVWNLFPEGQVLNLHCWDYNDVAPAYFAALQRAVHHKEAGIIVVHVARPDNEVVDRNTFADTDPLAASKGCYVIREYDSSKPRGGTVLVQGTASTVNLVKVMPRLVEAGHNVRVISVISEDLFALQPKEYQEKVLPTNERMFDVMTVSTSSKRVDVLPGLGAISREYSLTPDFDDKWRTGGTESDVIAEAHMDPEHIFQAVSRFASEREQRLEKQKQALLALF
eukprot:TRINITY_DN3300_c0_g1_i1.p1 TRINITY_DN3300_c0_g1~~TRINITY_DN3300_c0_g1_i1.p1  ORF type:complete len:869 (-),score=151.33 TRINITY_DN3300_c0_g1_i1:25-2589(-)